MTQSISVAQLPALPLPDTGRSKVGERAARAEIRRQIGQLEGLLCELQAEAHPHPLNIRVQAGGPARLLSLEQLESLRDSLAVVLEDARRELSLLRASQEQARGMVERMLADPASYRWLRVSREEAGLVGCGHWHVRPRFGLLGMAMGWWRVKISSGCPLASFIGLCPEGAGV